jgi:NAD(P)H-hydrate epimerase
MKATQKVPELPPRRADAHKGDFGRLLILAGSSGMAGAAELAGHAALRAGAGIVTIGTPVSVYPILAAKVTCCLTRPFPETPQGTLSDRGHHAIAEFADGMDVVALGPGLGRHPSTTKLVHRLVAELKKPMVIDADGLNALAEDVDALQHAPGPRVLTPHPGEMTRLAGMTMAEVQKARRQAAFWFAREHGVVVVLKGHRTIVSAPDHIYINTTGNPGMATGGIGDVLTGIIAALLGQGLAPFGAAVLGTYIHGLAGDLAAEKVGRVSLMATDLLDALPQAFLRHHRKPSR